MNPANLSFTPQGPSLTIGTAGSGALTYSQTWNGAGAWLASVDGTVTVSGSFTTVGVGFSAESFSLSGSTYTSAQGTGATLTLVSGIYTYTDHSGVVYKFQSYYSGGSTTYPYLLSSITHPNGEIETFNYATGTYTSGSVNYTVARLQSVTNNLGYQLQVQYYTNTLSTGGTNLSDWLSRTVVTGINNAVEYCDPTAVSCTLTGSWPKLTYTEQKASSTQTATDAAGYVTTYTYDAANELTKIALASGVATTIGYSSPFVVSSVSNGTGTWNYSYNSGTHTTTVTDPLSHSSTMTTSLSVVTGTTDALGRTTAYAYDSGFNRLDQITFPEGDQIQYTYDSQVASVTRGNIVTVTRVPKPGSGLSNTTTTYVYDSSCTHPAWCNQPESVTDARSNTTSFTYDNTYGVLTKIDPPTPGATAPETRLSYTPTAAQVMNSSGSVVAEPSSVDVLTGASACQTEAASTCPGTSDEVKTTVAYAGLGSSLGNNLAPTSVTTAAGGGSPTATSSMTYDDYGNVATATGPLGSSQTTYYYFDADRRSKGVIGPNASGNSSYPAIKYTYDSNDGFLKETETGSDTSQNDPTFAGFSSVNQTTLSVDGLDRPAYVTFAGGGTTYNYIQYAYDNANRTTCVAVRMNPSVFGSISSTSACSLGTAGSNGNDRITAYTYDNANELTQVTVASGAAVQANYVTKSYTDDSLVGTVADADNNLTTYVYDGFNRLSQVDYPSTTQGQLLFSDPTDYEAYTYDANDNVLTVRKRSNDTVTLTYDALNRVTEKAVPSWSGSNTYLSYDLLNRLTSANYGSTSGTPSVAYAYDALSRVTSETTTATVGTFAISSQYDAAGDRTQITWPDSIYATYTYDNLRHPTQVTITAPGPTTTTLATYAYDNLGQVTGITRGNGADTSVTYDGANRLDTLGHTFNGGAGNVTWTYSYDAANGLLSRSSTNDSYTSYPDNQTQSYLTDGLNRYASVSGTSFSYDGRANLSSDGTRTFTFDVDNKLLTGSAPTAATFTYDPTNRMLTDASGGSTTTFVYDGASLSAEYNSSGAVLRRYVPSGLGMDQPLLWYEGSDTSTPRYLHADNQGSIAAYSDGSGNEDAIYGYDPFGLPDSSSGWAGSRYRYTGQLMIPEADLYNYKARAYDPNLGRFLQTDPAGYGSDLNTYAYVHNGPTSFSDPTGMTSCPSNICPTPLPGLEVTATEPDDPSGLENLLLGIAINDYEDTILTAELNWMSADPPFPVASLTVVARKKTTSEQAALPRGCSTYSHMNFDANISGTLFAAVVGANVSPIGGGISIPTSAFSGDLRGTQGYVTASATLMGGIGAFIGGGPSAGFSITPTALPGGLSTSSAPVLGGAYAEGVGGELQGTIGNFVHGLGDLSEGVAWTGSGGPRGGLGGYLGGGAKGAITLATPASWTGC